MSLLLASMMNKPGGGSGGDLPVPGACTQVVVTVDDYETEKQSLCFMNEVDLIDPSEVRYIDWGDGVVTDFSELHNWGPDFGGESIELYGCVHEYKANGNYTLTIVGAHHQMAFTDMYGLSVSEPTMSLVSAVNNLSSSLRSCYCMFYRSDKLTEFDFSLIPPTVTDTSEMFAYAGLRYIHTLSLPASVRWACSMFYGAPIERIDNFEKPITCPDISAMFEECGNLEYIGNFELGEGVEDAAGLFFAVNKLQHLPITRLPDSLINTSWMFIGMHALTDDISNWFNKWTPKTRSVGGMFDECDHITGTAPARRLWKNADANFTDTEYCFHNCTSLDNYDEIPVSWGGPYEGDYELEPDPGVEPDEPEDPGDDKVYNIVISEWACQMPDGRYKSYGWEAVWDNDWESWVFVDSGKFIGPFYSDDEPEYGTVMQFDSQKNHIGYPDNHDSVDGYAYATVAIYCLNRYDYYGPTTMYSACAALKNDDGTWTIDPDFYLTFEYSDDTVTNASDIVVGSIVRFDNHGEEGVLVDAVSEDELPTVATMSNKIVAVLASSYNEEYGTTDVSATTEVVRNSDGTWSVPDGVRPNARMTLVVSSGGVYTGDVIEVSPCKAYIGKVGAIPHLTDYWAVTDICYGFHSGDTEYTVTYKKVVPVGDNWSFVDSSAELVQTFDYWFWEDFGGFRTGDVVFSPNGDHESGPPVCGHMQLENTPVEWLYIAVTHSDYEEWLKDHNPDEDEWPNYDWDYVKGVPATQNPDGSWSADLEAEPTYRGYIETLDARRGSICKLEKCGASASVIGSIAGAGTPTYTIVIGDVAKLSDGTYKAYGWEAIKDPDSGYWSTDLQGSPFIGPFISTTALSYGNVAEFDDNKMYIQTVDYLDYVQATCTYVVCCMNEDYLEYSWTLMCNICAAVRDHDGKWVIDPDVSHAVDLVNLGPVLGDVLRAYYDDLEYAWTIDQVSEDELPANLPNKQAAVLRTYSADFEWGIVNSLITFDVTDNGDGTWSVPANPTNTVWVYTYATLAAGDVCTFTACLDYVSRDGVVPSLIDYYVVLSVCEGLPMWQEGEEWEQSVVLTKAIPQGDSWTYDETNETITLFISSFNGGFYVRAGDVVAMTIDTKPGGHSNALIKRDHIDIDEPQPEYQYIAIVYSEYESIGDESTNSWEGWDYIWGVPAIQNPDGSWSADLTAKPSIYLDIHTLDGYYGAVCKTTECGNPATIVGEVSSDIVIPPGDDDDDYVYNGEVLCHFYNYDGADARCELVVWDGSAWMSVDADGSPTADQVLLYAINENMDYDFPKGYYTYTIVDAGEHTVRLGTKRFGVGENPTSSN